MVKKEYKYTLGLDIGIASVGWCLLEQDGYIVDLGVRAFNKAENPDGGSLNADRRDKRSVRKRLKRRRQRLHKAKKLFVEYGLLASNKPQELHNTNEEQTSPWELRVYGLDQLLTGKQFAQALHHIVKYRGFRSTRKSENASTKEAGKLLGGVQNNSTLLKEVDEHGKPVYRTPAEIAFKHPEYQAHKRNKRGEYTHTFLRLDLLDEVKQLFEAQREFGNENATEAFQKEIEKNIWEQKPALSGDDILNLIGHCTFESKEKRTPKAGYSFERFMWLQKLNSITVYESGFSRRRLTDAEKDVVREEPYRKGGNKFTYKQLRTLLEKQLGFASDAKFVGLTYGNNDVEAVEKATVVELKAYQQIRKAYEKVGLKDQWQKLSFDHEKLDGIGYALTVYKTDEDITRELKEKGLPDSEIELLLGLSFQKVGHLSLTAIQKLLPHLEQGLRYDEAASAEYENHRAKVEAKASKLLPPISKEDIRNPIVYRGLNQARKVINAIIKKYGSPMAVHIELARELSQSFEERRKISTAQKKYQEEKQSAINLCKQELGLLHEPKGLDLMKFRLYREQDGKCAYSLKSLDLRQLLSANYVEVDHALPYSRSYDNSQLNKVLVLTAQNRNKGNKTPFEYLNGSSDSEQWRMFEASVLSNPKYRQAKRNRLLRKVLSKEDSQEFVERNLNDTRYIGKYLKNQIEQYLKLNYESKAQRCVVVQGRMTSFLRVRWGILKVRSASDLHHAVDAAVVAACSHAMVKRISDYSRQKELQNAERGYIDYATGEVLDIDRQRQLENKFPEPWNGFRDELKARLSDNPQEHLKALVHYDEDLYNNVKPVLVSRAPQRRNTGAAHQETVRSTKYMEEDGVSTIRTPLSKLTLKSLESMVAKDDPRNKPLYLLLKGRLEDFQGKGDKAFDAKQPPVLRPRQDGTVSANIVKSIKLQTTQKSGVPVRQGIADNDSMIRVDVFLKDKKYWWIPVYVADIAKENLPNKVVFGKSEADWKEIDETYNFCFSLYPNDLIHIKTKSKNLVGYFAGADRATGNFNFWSHDRNENIGNSGLIRSVGIKSASIFHKYHIDVLGNKYKSQGEERNDLAQYRNKQKSTPKDSA